jgi:hypothetical protein
MVLNRFGALLLCLLTAWTYVGVMQRDVRE